MEGFLNVKDLPEAVSPRLKVDKWVVVYEERKDVR